MTKLSYNPYAITIGRTLLRSISDYAGGGPESRWRKEPRASSTVTADSARCVASKSAASVPAFLVQSAPLSLADWWATNEVSLTSLFVKIY
jgi:hypothetical protein